jgi:hypothetical protein
LKTCAIDALLVAAEQRLDEATRDRQAKLLEFDLADDGPPTNAIILRLVDERDACIDALAAVDESRACSAGSPRSKIPAGARSRVGS